MICLQDQPFALEGRYRTVRLVASKNDPDATLQLRVDGTESLGSS